MEQCNNNTNLKRKEIKRPQNYIGISLLNTSYKIYAKILNEKLKVHSEKFLMELQCGFHGRR
jgi:hypothetical protein